MNQIRLFFFLSLSSFMITAEQECLKKIKIFGKSFLADWKEVKSEGSREWLIAQAIQEIMTLDHEVLLTTLGELRTFIECNAALIPATKDKWLMDVLPKLETGYKKAVQDHESKSQEDFQHATNN